MKAASKEDIIYEECHKRLYFTALRILNNQFEAEEVMHDTLLKFFARGGQFSSDKERNSWMTRVCINMSIDRLRKRESGLFRYNINEGTDIKESMEDVHIDEEYSYKGVTVQMIKSSLEKLADGYRLVLSLYLFEGYDYEEIAQITKLKEVSVRSQFIRGRARLISELEKMKPETTVKHF